MVRLLFQPVEESCHNFEFGESQILFRAFDEEETLAIRGEIPGVAHGVDERPVDDDLRLRKGDRRSLQNPSREPLRAPPVDELAPIGGPAGFFATRIRDPNPVFKLRVAGDVDLPPSGLVGGVGDPPAVR